MNVKDFAIGKLAFKKTVAKAPKKESLPSKVKKAVSKTVKKVVRKS